MAKKRIIVIPKRYLKTAKQKSTRATRDKRTGRLTGRVQVAKKFGDTTKTRYISKDIDVDKDKKIDYYAGELFGRSKKVIVKKSKNRRGTVRKLR